MGCTSSAPAKEAPGGNAVGPAKSPVQPGVMAAAASAPVAEEAPAPVQAPVPAGSEKAQEGEASPDSTEPLLQKGEQDSSAKEDEPSGGPASEEAKPSPAVPRTSCWQWARLIVIWLCCTLAAGIMPGQAVFVNMFAKAGVLGGVCDESDKLPCDQQVAQMSLVFTVGMTLGYLSLIPNGLLFDLYGGRPMGVGGAVAVSFGLFLMAIAIFSAMNGTDAYTNWLVVVAGIITDLGSMINSYCFFGLVWHYPGSMTLILSLSTATYQVSALLPIVLQWLMDLTGLHLGYAMLFFAASVLLTVPALNKLTPTQQDYYDQAQALLGVPLPKVKVSFDLCEKLKKAWKAVRIDLGDHIFMCCGFAFSTTLAGTYTTMSSAYGKFLFGSQEAGDQLAQMQVAATATVGAICAPIMGKFIDWGGLHVFIWALTLFIAVPAGIFYLPAWWAAWVTTFGYCMFTSLSSLFMNRYFLHYAPPNRLGTYTGVCMIIIMAVMLPCLGVTDGFIMTLPEEQRFFYPYLALSALSLLSLVLFNVRFCYIHEGRGVPALPRMLPEDELELCMPLGAMNLDEASEITGLEKEVLFKRMADPDPVAMKELMSLVNTDKVTEAFAKHDADDFIAMLEASPEAAEEDEEEEAETARAADAQPLLSDTSSPRSPGSASPKEGKADDVEAQVAAAQQPTQMLAKDLREAFRIAGPEKRREELKSLVGGEEDSAIRARALGECLGELVREGDAEGCKLFLLELPVDDQWKCFVAMEDWMTDKEQKDLDKKFNKLVPPKQFAALMKQNRELKDLVSRLMKRELQRSVSRFRGKK